MRIRAGLKMIDVAKATGYTESFISVVERGKRRCPPTLEGYYRDLGAKPGGAA